MVDTKDTLNNDAGLNHLMQGAQPLTSKQFLSFETIAIGIFALFVAVCVYVWNVRTDEITGLKSDVKTITVVTPTLATKAEMNVKLDALEKRMDNKFEQMDNKMERRFSKMEAKTDQKFERMDTKMDALIASVNNMQQTVITQVAINSYKIDQLIKANEQDNKVQR